MKNKYIKEDIKENITMFTRYPLKLVSILIVKYLQKKYKKLSIDSKYKQSSIRLANLKLFQYLLYYFKIQFSAWGYFHPSCIWTEKDEKFFIKLFPEKDFEEIESVVWYNPNAVTYYHNKIYRLSKGKSFNYAKEIENQLKEWKDWD
jgi:hypothetical protein